MRASPAPVVGLSDIAEVALGHGYSCARDARGKVACWGGFEPRFDPDENDNRVFVPVTGRPIEIVGVEGAAKLTAGVSHGCAELETGAVSCWGRNETAQVARRRWSALRYEATRAPIRRVAGLDAGGFHNCAVVRGRVRCWGGVNGAVAGNRLTTTPTVVRGLSGIVQVAAGRRHTCALGAAGDVRCWGDSWFGALGPAVPASPGARRERPIAVAGLPPVVEVAVGEHHSCARDVEGAVYCWGGFLHRREAGGWLYPVTLPVPLRVAGVTDAVEIACGTGHTCVRRAGGEVWCFGANHRGQLGDGTTRYRRDPVPVSGLRRASQIDAGTHHSCARLDDGALFCWGDNRAAELGDGTVPYRSTPVIVGS
jgi:alpha-tubulin suppressor-like RCC1 family protein